uniref:Ig-like domain-containing protein n=1 Tax=Chrysemys picta bellii TaxID=8478 RepID=A0A8C3G0H0_CHRPI
MSPPLTVLSLLCPFTSPGARLHLHIPPSGAQPNPALWGDPAPGRSAQLTHNLAGRLLPSSPHYGNLTTLQDAEPAGDLAEFLIRNVSWRDAGSYSCYYHHYWYSFIWSHPSDPVELVVAGEGYPKPSILLSPSGVVPLGGAVTVQCWGWHWHWHWYQNMRFLLYKDGNPNMLQDVEPRWDLADFLIRNVSWRDAGSYGCYYYSHWNPLIWSHPSDPVELVVLPAPGPSISVRPSGVIALGQVVTIRCQCRCGARRLFLYKGGMEIQELDAAGDGGEFTIPSARWEDGGAYSCRSHSRSEPPDWSYPSDTVWIIVAGERYPKPSISLSPSGDVALGGAVTVQCRGRHQNVRFLLYKDGNPNALQNTEPAGNVAEFPIHSVSQRHAGSYSCYYYSHWNPPVWSHPSDPVELVVAGEGPGSVSPCSESKTNSADKTSAQHLQAQRQEGKNCPRAKGL